MSAFVKHELNAKQTGIYDDILANDYDRERLQILVDIFEDHSYLEKTREFFLTGFSTVSQDAVEERDPNNELSMNEKYDIQWNLLVELRGS